MTGVLAILLLLTLVLAACGETKAPAVSTGSGRELQTQKVSVEGGSYTNVNAAGLAEMLKAGDFVLINVHIPYDGEIDRTDLFVPYDAIEANLSKLPADRGAKLVVYCRSGPMSTTAAHTLVGLGYRDVWNLEGGMVGWQRAGYALASKGR